MSTVTYKVIHLGPCSDARVWMDGYTDPALAWAECKRGDWMLWLVGRLSKKGSKARKRVVLCACECARLTLKHVPRGEMRPLKAIKTAEAWARGEGARLGDVRAAADAAAAAAYAAAYADAAAYAAAYAAAAAAAAADAYAAAAAAAAAARITTLCQCADIVRKHYPKPPRIKGQQ